MIILAFKGLEFTKFDRTESEQQKSLIVEIHIIKWKQKYLRRIFIDNFHCIRWVKRNFMSNQIYWWIQPGNKENYCFLNAGNFLKKIYNIKHETW